MNAKQKKTHKKELQDAMERRLFMEKQELKRQLKEADRINKSVIDIATFKIINKAHRSVPEMMVSALNEEIKELKEKLVAKFMEGPCPQKKKSTS